MYEKLFDLTGRVALVTAGAGPLFGSSISQALAEAGATVDLSPVVTRTLADDDGSGWIGKGKDIDLRNLRGGVQRLGAYLFDVKGAVMTRGSRASAGAWCNRPLSRVPLQLPAAGCTTRPAGLSSTSSAASS